VSGSAIFLFNISFFVRSDFKIIFREVFAFDMAIILAKIVVYYLK